MKITSNYIVPKHSLLQTNKPSSTNKSTLSPTTSKSTPVDSSPSKPYHFKQVYKELTHHHYAIKAYESNTQQAFLNDCTNLACVDIHV